jgi:hypothetical protein
MLGRAGRGPAIHLSNQEMTMPKGIRAPGAPTITRPANAAPTICPACGRPTTTGHPGGCGGTR